MENEIVFAVTAERSWVRCLSEANVIAYQSVITLAIDDVSFWRLHVAAVRGLPGGASPVLCPYPSPVIMKKN